MEEKYFVQWKNQEGKITEKDFYDYDEAYLFAEIKHDTGINVYIWLEIDGVREEVPMASMKWADNEE